MSALASDPFIPKNATTAPTAANSAPTKTPGKTRDSVRRLPPDALAMGTGKSRRRRNSNRRENGNPQCSADLLGRRDQPDATPASSATTPLTAPIVTGTKESPSPTPASRKPGSKVAA